MSNRICRKFATCERLAFRALISAHNGRGGIVCLSLLLEEYTYVLLSDRFRAPNLPWQLLRGSKIHPFSRFIHFRDTCTQLRTPGGKRFAYGYIIHVCNVSDVIIFVYKDQLEFLNFTLCLQKFYMGTAHVSFHCRLGRRNDNWANKLLIELKSKFLELISR